MAVVIDSDVKAILDTEIDTTPFILAASVLIRQHLAAANLPADLLFELERWLAAHLACVRDARFTQVRSDSVGMTYQQSKPGIGLDATSYGSQVKLLDPTGILALVSSTTRPASIRVD